MNNRTKLLAVIACLILAFSFCLYGCGASESDSDSASTSAPEKHLLGYPDGYDTTSGGGSSYDGWCDNPDTPYFKINDYYNMESDGTLHILTNFASYQQSTEYSCGPACGVMVLNWFGGDVNKYDELTICKFSGTTEDAMELDGIGENTAVVGTLSRPNSEAILALEPDLVLLAVDIPAQKELKAELDEMGIRTMAIEIDSFEDYKACMKELTELTGRDDLYEQNAVQVGERIEAIKADVQNGSSKDSDSAAGTQSQAGTASDSDGSISTDSQSDNAVAADNGSKTFLALRVSATKNKVLKDDYFACEIFRDFGLRNIAEDDSRIDELNIEAIVAANPDYIFIIPQGKESEAMESYKTQFESNEVWSSLDAVNRGRLYTMPKDYFQYKPNAQWDLAYEYVRDLLKES